MIIISASTGFALAALFVPPSPPLRGGLFGENGLFQYPYLITFFYSAAIQFSLLHYPFRFDEQLIYQLYRSRFY